MPILTQMAWLYILAIPVASVSWTVTQEQIFIEPRTYCVTQSNLSKWVLIRKFFYLFTCEYCFSHYVTALFLWLTGYHLLLNNWDGYVIAGFALVWVANMYMGFFALLRQDLKKEKKEIEFIEHGGNPPK